MQKKVFSAVLAILTVLFWGITFVSTKILLKSFSPLEILFVRFVLAFLGLLVFYPKMERVELKDNLIFMAAALTGVVIYQLSENIAINYTTASNVSVIVSICPMFTAIICQIFLKEKSITPFFIIGFVISIVGVFFVSLNGKIELHINPLGDILAFCASVCWGFYSLFVSLINKKGYAPLFATRRVFFFAIIFMIPLLIVGGHFSSDSSIFVNFNLEINKIRFSDWKNWIHLCFLGLIASGFCFAAWNKACNDLGTVKTSVGLYCIPLVTIIFSFFVLGEKISLMGAIGSILTITGLFISSIKSKKTSD